jgi:hypothetical protein
MQSFMAKFVQVKKETVKTPTPAPALARFGRYEMKQVQSVVSAD